MFSPLMIILSTLPKYTWVLWQCSFGTIKRLLHKALMLSENQMVDVPSSIFFVSMLKMPWQKGLWGCARSMILTVKIASLLLKDENPVPIASVLAEYCLI